MCGCASSWSRFFSVCVNVFSVIAMATGTIFVLHRAVSGSYSVTGSLFHFKTCIKDMLSMTSVPTQGEARSIYFHQDAVIQDLEMNIGAPPLI